jgi:hypothetical protein
MNYDDMSDFEISWAVADFKWMGFVKYKQNGVARIQDHNGDDFYFDPCNNPSDAWPIIVDNSISLNSPDEAGTDGWEASVLFYNNRYIDKEYINTNPLRAAMVCYLMMQEGK